MTEQAPIDDTPTPDPHPRHDPSEYASGFGSDNPEHEIARAAVLTGGDLVSGGKVGLLMCPDPYTVRYWPTQSMVVRRGDPAAAPQEVPEGYDSRLVVTDREAMAIYRALAEHFGHSPHDTAALRRDLDHERRERGKVTDALVTIALREPAPAQVHVVGGTTVDTTTAL